jgi:hypothetical protein
MLSRSIPVFLMAAILALGLAAGSVSAQAPTSNFWTDISPSAIAPVGERVIQPVSYRTLSLDQQAIRSFLSQVPMEGTPSAVDRAVIELPMPAGGFDRFAIVESPVMAPELGAMYPEIRTYAGYGLDDPSATIRFDLVPQGFHALILSENGSICIDPFQRGDVTHYQSYYRSDHLSGGLLGGCTVVDDDGMGAEIASLVGDGHHRSGTQLRTYRAAIAATGEYTTYHGGTVALGLAAVVTSLNRVTGVYEREVSIRMVLIPNNNLIIYTNAATDPYTNNNGSTMLGQNQANLDAVIGSANYDIGHVFSTGGGGIAGLGVVCRTGNKARGVTGSTQPIGDNFDIDYVAHEMGHQFGSNHCFNGNAGSCAGGNRNASTAYEPGSGSTIMAYAGICGAQNLQGHSDDYFVWISTQEIVAYSTTGSGNACAVTTPTGVIEPTVDAGVGAFTIPLNTPFALTATATTTGTPTYCWEESDLGPAGHPNTPSGNAPIFRSFDPVASPTRLFPKLSNILNNTQTMGEILPSYARNLSFRVTVRDTQAGGVGVRNDGISFAVAANGPFLVTYPNTVLTWLGGTQETVTWDVAGTNAAPVNCATVNILISTDGGNTWPAVVAAGTPNDGSEQITVPTTPTTQARLKIEAADNIFFDLSNRNFTIEYSADVAEQAVSPSGLKLYVNSPNPFNPNTTIRFEMPQAGPAAVRIYDASGRLVRTLVEEQFGAGAHQVLWNGRDSRGRAVDSGVYLYKLDAMGETLSGRMTLTK